jgi:hypothetical protein
MMGATRRKKVDRSIDDEPDVKRRRQDVEHALEEAEGEVQQKDGGQDRQAGEPVEDQRERIRRNARRF